MSRVSLHLWIAAFLFYGSINMALAQGVEEPELVLRPPPLEAPKAERVREFFTFEYPSVPTMGPLSTTWFFLRQDRIWSPGGIIDLTQLKWPFWDAKQIPLSLVPLEGQQFSIRIWGEDGNVIETLALSSNFFPDVYLQRSKIRPTHYQIILIMADGRSEVGSPKYSWPYRKRVSHCGFKVRERKMETLFAETEEFKLCTQGVLAFINSNEIPEQRFVRIQYPKLLKRGNLARIRPFERELRTAAVKHNSIVMINSDWPTEDYSLEMGLTLYEKLPGADQHQRTWQMAQAVQQIQDKQQNKISLHRQENEDGSFLEIFGYYSDQVQGRRLLSPLLGNREVDLQFVQGRNFEGEGVRIVESREPDVRTGYRALLRPWQVLATGTQNQVSSSRGDRNALTSIPGFEGRYGFEAWPAQIFLSMDRSSTVVRDELEMTEFKAGYEQKLGGPLSFRLGVHQFNLAGTVNVTRLGSVAAAAGGIGVRSVYGQWRIGTELDLLIGNAQSYDAQLEFGRLLGSSSVGGWYVGLFAGYTNYQGYVKNRINIRELLSETRTQYGIQFGFTGRDIWLF